MTQTAIITGATGLLGRQVLKAFQRANWNAIGTGFTRAQSPIEKLDLNNPAEISQLLDSAKQVLHSPSALPLLSKYIHTNYPDPKS